MMDATAMMIGSAIRKGFSMPQSSSPVRSPSRAAPMYNTVTAS